MIDGVDDGILKSAGVVETQVQFAGLGFILDGLAWTNVCLERVKTERDDLLPHNQAFARCGKGKSTYGAIGRDRCTD